MSKARYEYSCIECGGEVQKYKPTGEIMKGRNAGELIKAGLHGWSCKLHGKGVSVKRRLK